MNKRTKIIIFFKVYILFFIFVILFFIFNIFYSDDKAEQSIYFSDYSNRNAWSKTLRAYDENIFFDDELIGELAMQFVLCEEQIENSYIQITSRKGSIKYNKSSAHIMINNEQATIIQEGEVTAFMDDYISSDQMQDLFYEYSSSGAISGALVGTCLSECTMGGSILAGIAVGSCAGGAWGLVKGALKPKSRKTSCLIKIKICCKKIEGIWVITDIVDLSEVFGIKAKKCGDLYII